MGKPLPLWGKFLTIVVSLGILTVLIYVLHLRAEFTLLLFAFFPVVIILAGKGVELVMRSLEKAATGPLSLTEPKNAISLLCYYILTSLFLVILIENSIILSLLKIQPDEWQVALMSLSLAFFPRVLSYASGMERARNTLLAIFTPLTLTATATLLAQPASITLRFQSLEFCIIGSVIQIIAGDLALYFAGFSGIIHPLITVETISMVDLRRLVHSQLETIQWERISQVLREAKRLNRVDIIQKILSSMDFFVDESRRRGAKLCRISYADALIRSIYFEQGLRQELIPRLGALKKDREGDVRARAVYGYRVLSRIIPEESLQHLSELLQDNDLNVLREVGYALLPLLGHNPIAVEYAIKLSLNPVVLDAFTEMPEHGMLRARDLEELIKSEQVYDPRASSPLPPNLTHSKVSPIIHVLRLAHASAPGLVVSHIQKCSLDKDTRLRLLAATILSDESFARSDKRLLGLRRDLENDEDYVIRDTLHSYRLLENLRRSGHVIQD